MGPRPPQGPSSPGAPFLKALRHQATRHERAAEALDDLLVEPVDGIGVTHYLQDDGELWQLREYAAQRSLYHLKEADPHAWVLPRLWGRAKAGMAAVEFDEFGGGRADRVHARLFADLMADLGLDTTYGRYLDSAGAEALAVVNLMSSSDCTAPSEAHWWVTSPPSRSPRRPVHGGSPRPCGAPARDRPPSTSTTSTSRPTPYMSRSYAGKSSRASSRKNPTWTATSRSAWTPPTTSRTALPNDSSARGGQASRRCVRPSDQRARPEQVLLHPENRR